MWTNHALLSRRTTLTRLIIAATAYLRMVLFGLVGLRFHETGFEVHPCVPKGVSYVELRNLRYRETQVNIAIRGTGTKCTNRDVDAQDTSADKISRTDILIELEGE